MQMSTRFAVNFVLAPPKGYILRSGDAPHGRPRTDLLHDSFDVPNSTPGPLAGTGRANNTRLAGA